MASSLSSRSLDEDCVCLVSIVPGGNPWLVRQMLALYLQDERQKDWVHGILPSATQLFSDWSLVRGWSPTESSGYQMQVSSTRCLGLLLSGTLNSDHILAHSYDGWRELLPVTDNLPSFPFFGKSLEILLLYNELSY